MVAYAAIISLLVAVVAAVLLVWILGRQAPGPRAGLVYLVILIFLAVWAIGLWSGPGRTPHPGLAAAAFLLAGAVVTLVLAAVLPKRRTSPTREAVDPDTVAATAAFAVFFYLAVFVLLGLIAMHYLHRPPLWKWVDQRV